MTLEAYISNHTKTGKGPRDFFHEAVRQHVPRPDTKTMEFVNWLKAHSGVGHARNGGVGDVSAQPGESRWRRRPRQNPLSPLREGNH